MKNKRILSLVLALCLCLCLAVSASADFGYEEYILDPDGIEPYGDSFGANNALAEEISNSYGMVVSCAVFQSSSGQDGQEITRALYEEKFGSYDGFILSYMWDENDIFIAAYGKASELFSDEELKEMMLAFDSQQYFDQCVDFYLREAHSLLQTKRAEGLIAPKEELPQVGPEAIPENRLKPLLVDEAGLLSPQEAEELLKTLNILSDEHKMDIALVTMNDFGGKEPQAFADDYYDYMGYGYGDNDDGILFAIDMDKRNWAISTYGTAIPAFTDYAQDYMTGEFLPYLSDGDYYTAFSEYARLCDEIIIAYEKGEPMEEPEEGVPLVWIPLSLIIGLVVAFVGANGIKRRLNTVHEQQGASYYTREGSMNMRVRSDLFMGSYTTQRSIKRESSSGGSSSGGSSTHTSSSGRSHGGSSGSF